MDCKDVERLKDCVEVAKLLSDSTKYVEDDTCLERMISAVEFILDNFQDRNNTVCDASTFLSVFKNPCNQVLNNPEKYYCSSVNYILKIYALFLKHMRGFSEEFLKQEVEELVVFPRLSLKNDENTPQHFDWFSSSLQSAWISTIKVMVSEYAMLKVVVCHLKADDLVSMIKSTSIFVTKEACSSIAELAVHLHRVMTENHAEVERETMQAFLHDLGQTTLDKCTLENYLEICMKMVIFDYESAICVMSESFQFQKFMKHNKEGLVTACVNGERHITHFIGLLYDKQMQNCPNACQLFPDQLVFNFAIIALLKYPTKGMGWSMLSSLCRNCPSLSKELFAMCKKVILLPINHLSGRAECDEFCGKEETLEKWYGTVTDIASNRMKMTSMLCNSLLVITQLWNQTIYEWDNLGNILISLFQNITGLNCAENGCMNVSCVRKNGKLATAFLHVFTECIEHFSKPSLIYALQIEVASLLLEPDYDHATVQACIKLILKLVHYKPDSEFCHKIVTISKRKLLDRRWEVRDSMLEFLAQFMTHVSDIENVFCESKLDQDILLQLKDHNSYVRASAQKLLRILISQTTIFDENLEHEILPMIMDTLIKEHEALPRRAAVFCLLSCIQKSENLTEQTLATLKNYRREISADENGDTSRNTENFDDRIQKLAHTIDEILFKDLDWEVKWNAIDIVEYFVHFLQEKSKIDNWTKKQSMDHQNELLQKLCTDCDKAVRDKAIKLYIRFVSDGVFHGKSNLNFRLDCKNDEQIILDLDNLLEEVLLKLSRKEQIKLTHGCHGPQVTELGHDNSLIPTEDVLVLDCY